jgi:outer membrane protein assembly factor BamE (lipoprotein component of BamABCDE complex)
MKTLLPGAAALLLLLAGCSTIEDRARERAAALDALPPEMREAALKGHLKEGMTPDAVYVALGRPSRATTGMEKGVSQERWVYTRAESREIPAWRDVPYRAPNGTVGLLPTYEPITVTSSRDSFEVKFENGKVVGWGGL